MLSVRVEAQVGTLPLRLDFEVPPGITLLFGPSGAGKSSSLQLIAGLSKPTHGKIRFGAVEWSSEARFVPPEARRVALVFQSLALFPHLTVEANVAFGVPADRHRAATVRASLARWGVERLADRRPSTLSGGEAQRVALARALAMHPSVLLLDEPFTALDRPLRRDLGQTLQQLVEELALPTLLVTHDVDEARALGTRLVPIEGGRTGPVRTVDSL